MTNLWKNFTYAIMILKFNANGEPEINYVTDVCDKQKTFEFHSIEEIKETDMEICRNLRKILRFFAIKVRE